MSRRTTLAAVIAATLSLTGCGSQRDTVSQAQATTTTPPACKPEAFERIDPGSAMHVLPGRPEPAYITDPPTSGPHMVGPIGGVVTEPIARPRQVGALEAGGVLIQYRDLGADEVAAITPLAGPDVTVAPNPTLPARIVATGWLVKQTCDRVDSSMLQAFIAAHLHKGADGH